ncbi:MAG: T9SS type A sorting domain-containing protein, partial [Bacteroidetes bacterium]|nr:T9SS type A sorting domain-containing protein [Bacteroidota bacterium]
AWSNGITNGVGFVPTNSAVYSVVGTATNGCTGNASVNVTVNQNPGLNATASPGSICAGSSSTLSIAGNAATYSVNSVASGNSVILTPTASANYTVSGASTQGCVTTTTLTVFVSSCVGIKENISEATSLLVYPNPSNGTFTLRTEGNETAVITNELGQVIKTIRLEGGKEEQVSGLTSGIYFVITSSTKNRIVVIY